MAKKAKQLKYKLLSIKTEQFTTIENIYKEEETTEINTIISFKSSSDHRIINSISKFSLLQKESVFLILEVSCSFGIKDESWMLIWNKSTDTTTLPRNFAILLAGLNIDTSRGILSSRTEQSPYKEVLIPILDISHYIISDVVITSIEG
ncbi:hypothetical protein SAMN05518672_103471 [Chitinophaga sp. CF118]|uniref:hypothetical protein n=1 Tax=Chitinophaga sp. CF118 TaxID=1884367 RepID=UPI0008E4E19A|nr:hypothetical protein [Chitinophaga sp. CF118]SFD84330.1 hypothetical protein SAMN05518672_103471 [Chitinophaga sp. CF118]